jgi:hypothetical protein
VAVYGVPRPDPEQVDEVLGRCEQLRTWARARGLALEGVPSDLGVLDEALDQASSGHAGSPRITALAVQAGLFTGTVIIAAVPGARWRVWPNGHPVVWLSSGRDLDVVAMASDRVSKDRPLLADIYADAARPAR